MDNRIKQILGVNKTKESVNTDTYINIQINDSKRLLPIDEINTVLDLGKQFNRERQSCSFYRIVGKINPIMTNVLFNTTGGIDTWQYLNNPIFTNKVLDDDDETLSFSESIKRNLKEIDGWYGYFDPVLTGSGLCNFYDMEPKRERFSFTSDITNIPNTRVKNWELTITYPYASDKNHNLVLNGLLIVDKQLAIVGGKYMTALSVPVKHNLSIGSTIALLGTNMDGEYEVKRVGLDNGDLKNYYFCIDVDFDEISVGNNSRVNKMYNGVKSEYYFRKFKKIKTKTSQTIDSDDYEIYKLSFSENIFNDDITQFVFNEDIDVSNLTDNLGRPLSELYLTIIKTSSNNIFGNVSSGIEAPLIQELNNGNTNTYLKTIPVIQKIHNVSSAPSQTFTPLENVVLIGNNDFYGDIVEYNDTTVEEVVLGDIFHRFNTINRELTSNGEVSGPRPEGYYYKAHHLIKIREFSSYIEEGTTSTAGMPDYKVDLGDGRYIWRDLLDIGVVDINKPILNYPFVNGCHYIFQNYCFDVRRQDPFDNWNLYHAGFPADPIGNMMDNRFKINIANNAC
jgi:hypothetical protein